MATSTVPPLGVRPTSKLASMMEWYYPGRVLRTERRWFETSGSSRDMTSAGTFDLAPAAGEAILVGTIQLAIEDSGTWTFATFGGASALPANGIQISTRKGGSEVHEFTADEQILTNLDLAQHCGENFQRLTLDSGSAVLICGLDLVGQAAPILLDSTDDAVRIVVNDAPGVDSMIATSLVAVAVKD